MDGDNYSICGSAFKSIAKVCYYIWEYTNEKS